MKLLTSHFSRPFLPFLVLSFTALFSASAAQPVIPAEWTILPVPAATAAQLIRVDPDRANWTYAPGEPVTFRITVALDPFPAEGVPIKYLLGPEMIEGAEKTATVPATGLTLPPATLPAAGFLRCIVTATVAGKAQRGLATAGFSPDKIQPTQTEPADFDQFWTAQKAALAKIPAEPELTPAPDLSNDKVEVFYLSLQNVGNYSGPSRLHGVLAVPRGPGPFPALLSVPGAGVRPYKGQVSLAEKGLITLQIGIHGVPVNFPQSFYDQLGRGALADYPRFNLDDRIRYYYRRVYLGCVRANDYLVAHPKWDGKNLVVMGGSQGGQLSLVTAGLDSRVTALAADYPAYSDVTGYLSGRAGGWPGLFRPARDAAPLTVAANDPQLTTTRYYDAVNFARRIKVPGHYSWGYNDETCPPTSTFAAYNTLTAPKELVIAPQQGHAASAPQTQQTRDWVLKQVASAKP
ncbi:MAG: acetylxylan esterase [Verrucomicrobia bacterium]|nr:acetylxylan esterase [Verrucomicrobiota bacterium]